MGTLTSLLDLSRNALTNNQTAIDVTAQNIANQGVSGYARRTISFSTADSVQLGTGTPGVGATISVTAQRDRVLDQSVQQATQASSAADARLTALQQLQSLFSLKSDGTSDASGITSAMNGLFNSFTALEANPTASTTRQGVLNAAQSFASAVQSVSAQIGLQQGTLSGEISSSVTQANSLLQQIADVNGKISTSGAGTDTGTLEDQRQSLLNQLSQLMDFQQVRSENGGLSLLTSNGTALVIGSNAYALSTTSTSSGLAVVGNNGVDVTSQISGGSIGGMLQVLKNDIPSAQSALDALAYGVASAINATNEAGNTTSGAPGSAIFQIPATADGAASSISVSLTSVDGIAAASATEGPAGASNAATLAALATASTVNGQKASNYMASFLTALGGTVSSATTAQSVASGVLTQATTQRDSLSGVSLDEEAANLTQYQRSYEAAAKVFTIVDQLMASALNLGTETSVS